MIYNTTGRWKRGLYVYLYCTAFKSCFNILLNLCTQIPNFGKSAWNCTAMLVG